MHVDQDSEEQRDTILIVDDDPGLRKTLADILGRQGYAVTAVASGRAALDGVKLEAPAVALIDLVLEDLPGLEVLARIRESSPLTECILLTGHADMASAIEAMNLGAFSFLQKPFEVEKLQLHLHRAIEKRELGRKLRESEERLALAVRGAELGTWDYDLRTGIVSRNDRFAEMLGYSPGEIEPSVSAWNMLVHPDDLVRYEADLEQFLEGHEDALDFVCRARTKTNQWRSILIRGSVVARDENGRPLRLAGTHLDITDHTLAVRKLRLTNGIIRELSEAAEVETALRKVLPLLKEYAGLDAVGIRLSAKEDYPYFETSGFPAEFVRQETLLCARDEAGELIADSEGAPLLECMCGNVIQGRFDPSLPFFTKRGSFWTNSTSRLIAGTTEEDRQGHTRNHCNRAGYESVALIPLSTDRKNFGLIQLNDHRPDCFTPGLIADLEDIAATIAGGLDRMEAVDDLRRSYISLHKAQTIAKLGFLEWNLARNEVAWSDEVYRILGTERGIGVSTLDETLALVHPDDQARVRNSLDAAVAGGPRFNLELRGVRPDEQVIWLHAQADLVCDPEGNPAYMLATVMDITQRKEIEQQLFRAQKLDGIGQLAGGVAHDFNNLLTVIGGYAEMMVDRLDPDHDLHSKAIQITRAAERAAGLTRQLLAFSRRQVLEPKTIDLNAVLLDMDKMLQRLIGEDVRLQSIRGAGLWPVFVDPGQIEQVILNFAVNSRDAMPHGGIITIETQNVVLGEDYVSQHVEARPGRHVMLAVSDTGCGMSREVMKQVFEPFFTTKERGKGTGLGLSTAYGIVKQSQGSICLYSEVGKGTSFKVYLPASDAEVALISGQEEREEAPLGDETILLAEDEEWVRNFAVEVLCQAGYRVLSATNGVHAITVADEHAERIDLLLTDLVMPELGGAGLAEAMATSNPETRIMFTTGYAEHATRTGGHLKPGVNLLQKPYSPDALLRKVREVLDAE